MESAPGQNIERKDYEKFIPLDKYWIIRMGILDILHGRKDINTFLNEQKDLGGDLSALKRVCEAWDTGESLDVGESGTIYRIVQFIIWKQELEKKISTRGSLTERIKNGYLTQDPKIVNYTLDELSKLDKGTTQWATAAILTGSVEKLSKGKFFTDLTYEAMEHWQAQRAKGEKWIPRKDIVLMRQAGYFLALLQGKKTSFTPLNPDDYCFARVFGLIDKEFGEREYPEAEGHESNRFEVTEKAISQAEAGEIVEAKDHRIIQALAMWGIVNKREVKFAHPEEVNKSWPLFWEFLELARGPGK